MRHFATDHRTPPTPSPKAEEPFKTIIYDDGCTARELNRSEQWMLESVCGMLGCDVEDYREEAGA